MPVGALGHVKSNTIGDFTGTVTVLDSQGSTATAAATNLVRPSDWNSVHQFTATISGNTAGSSTFGGTNLVLAGGNNVTLSVATAAGAATLSIVGAAGGGGAAPDRRFKEIIQGERMTTVVGLSATNVTNRPMFLPFWMEGTGLVPKTARMLVSAQSSSNRSLGGTFHVGVYSLANDTQMTLLASDSFSISSTATASGSQWNGAMWFEWTNMSNVTLTAEGRYAMAFMVNPVSANTAWMPATLYGADNMPAQSRIMRNGATVAFNATHQFVPFWGMYSTTTGAMPGSIAQSQVQGASSQSQFQFYGALAEI